MNLATYIKNNLDFDHIPTSDNKIIVFARFLNQSYFTTAKVDFSTTSDAFNIDSISKAETTIIGQIIADLFENMGDKEGVTITDNLSGKEKTIIVTKEEQCEPEVLDLDQILDKESEFLDMIEEEAKNSDYDVNFGMYI